MHPKLKTAVPPEAMVTQPDTPLDEVPPETQCMAELAPKKKRVRVKATTKGSLTKTGRPSNASVVTNGIAKKILVHPDVVQNVLGGLEEIAVETLKKNGVFRLTFITAKILTREAREATNKRVCGRDVALKAKPERRALKLTPSKTFKQLVA